MRRAPFFVGALMITTILNSSSMTQEHPTVVFAPGGDSCGKWNLEANLELRWQRETWIYGFVSAYNLI